MMSLELDFERWAAENAFVTSVHDAAFVGELDGVSVSLDTGCRHGRPFTTIARIERGTGEAPRNLRPTDATFHESPILRSLGEAIREDDSVLVVWADPNCLTVRSRCRDPEKLAAALRRLIHALEQHVSTGPYR